MESRDNKALSYLVSGLLGVVLLLVLPGCALLEALCGKVPQEPVDFLGGVTLLPERSEALHIKPGVASKFYERTIAGSRYREGKLNWNLLMSLIKDEKTPGPKILKLLPGVVIEFTPTSYKPIKGKQYVDAQKYRWAGLVTSKGKVVGEGLFIVDEKQQKMSATIDYNDKVYQIIPLKNGNLRIYELDPTRFPEEFQKIIHSIDPPTNPELGGPPLITFSSQALMASDSQPCVIDVVIDVLVLYTEDAERTWLNLEHDDIWWEFDNAIGITNEAFANSNVHAEVQIVARKLISHADFQESGILDSDLGKLQDPSFSLGAIAQKWRDDTGADLVSLWVAGGDWCGASPYFTKRLPDREGKDGFSVVIVGCAAVIKSLAHEIGHNLGARHTRMDEDIADSNTITNFGHLSWRDSVRTIMARNRECRDRGLYCRRVSQYSNPDIPYPSTTTMTGVSIDEGKAADNHRRLNETVCDAAKYRESPN